ncbi:leucine-rich repeat-containing G-protein coupled receptor 5A-like [Uranotaenia lowii]|uniref:leucine-rich repeat-containing G-protein coupled receptor 5A-like n=1 Tax=Uranotaenia lowii TaxID=190385 RepID=UPI00247A51B7|nr:leucine-rich repeat-containing G-protein coupled receptor 5A-like [Uranotaenia lowii]XP_055600910.1 leucine-rich repeat-containing G-protein coupled receptor 5A-like [Uranotaenia lowii]
MAVRFTNHLTTKGHVVLVLLVLLLFQSYSAKIVHGLSPTLQTTSQTKMMLKESLLIPSIDPEKEAKAMYEKALQQYGFVGRTLKEICKPWQLKGCQCAGSSEEVVLNCRGIGLETVPVDLPAELVKLDISNNNISSLPNKSFDMLPNLEELILSNNRIEQIDSEAFYGLTSLKKLTLQNCGLVRIPSDALRKIRTISSLQLDNNLITGVENVTFRGFIHLKSLRLEGNLLQRVPTEALIGLRSLEALNLGSNLLTYIKAGDFPLLENLHILLVKRNQISEITAGALTNLTRLKILELDDNVLSSVPVGLENLGMLQELSASGNRIQWISKDDFPRSLVTLELKSNPLVGIKPGALQNMSRLRKLILSDVRGLQELPPLDGCSALEVLRVDRANLTKLPDHMCKTSPRLRSLDLKLNRLKSIPNVTNCRDLRVLDIAGNSISSLHGAPFASLGQLHDLLLSGNEIESIPHDAFIGLPRLQVLDLESNHIYFIHPDAFRPLLRLEDLNLGNNVFPQLPSVGLGRLLHLKTFNNPNLREFPPPESFPRIQTLALAYAYHCCAFLPLMASAPRIQKQHPIKEEVLFPTDNEFDMSLWNNSYNDIWPQLQNLSKKFGTQINDLLHVYGPEYYPGGMPTYPEEYFEEEGGVTHPVPTTSPGGIQCLPEPGPFMPCQDLFDWWTLRCGVWVVFLLAMLGNGTVVFVLIFSRSKMDVPRFLVCNLAAADFFMGIYLGFLAVVDASTLGEFRMYAIPWQMSAGCKLSGFLAVLSSELSVYTLAVITLERNYAITHAMHLNKRLSLRHAGYIMTIGWTFAITMAILPLFGVSDYRVFAVCLPFEINNGSGSLFYVVFLMFINGVAFLILMGCYLKMYCAIRGSQAWNSNDSRIAKRMALLVFTDFICWSPIAFFSLTAIFGLHLISLEQAKVFTVFVLPLNSCCNPFLYAILTKQFKKDCVLICKAIEESRVTRGIGRCRHSSNFSNRQTPANTNSLMERSSRELPPLLPGQTCNCTAKLMEQENLRRRFAQQSTFSKTWRRLLCNLGQRGEGHRNGRGGDQYAYQIAEIQQKQHKRTGSVSSSENFSSSRSDSWRHAQHHCGIPLRLLDPRRRHTSWLITRKTSQDSNLSSSRNDSSGSTATQSTGTWRISRSSASNSVVLPGVKIDGVPHVHQHNGPRQSIPGGKPRLVRQSAVHDDSQELSCSPPRLGVRFLPTIPSAADSSVQLDDDTAEAHSSPESSHSHNSQHSHSEDPDDDGIIVITSNSSNVAESSGIRRGSGTTDNAQMSPTPFYAILHGGNPQATVSSLKDKTNKPP